MVSPSDLPKEVKRCWHCGEENLYAMIASLDPEFGYEADIDCSCGYPQRTWYCRAKNCSQPKGKPHLDGCIVGVFETLIDHCEANHEG